MFQLSPFQHSPSDYSVIFPPKNAVPPKQMKKEVDRSRRTQWVLNFQTCTFPSEPQVRLHLLPFDHHFTISSSLFPPPSLTHSLEKYNFCGFFPPCFLTCWYNPIVHFFLSSSHQRFPEHFCWTLLGCLVKLSVFQTDKRKQWFYNCRIHCKKEKFIKSHLEKSEK